MRTFRLPLTLVVTTLLACCATAQDFSNKGKEFWLAYCYHVGMVNSGGPPVMTLYITSDVATTYTVEVYGGLPIQSGSITPGQVVTATVPTSCFIDNEGTFTNKAIRVTAAKPVVVYSYITRSQASGATLCLPTGVLGKEYYSMNFTQASNEANANSYLTIIAVEDNTSVEITPSANTKNGWTANSLHTVNLNKGQIYQVLGALDGPNSTTGEDLTGTHVKSISSGTGGCKKIAVFSGSGKIRIPAVCSNNSSDNLYQQLYPTGSWGRRYLTAPSNNNPFNYYRVLKSDPAANVYVNGTLVPSTSFTNGLWYQFFNNRPNLIESDLPVSVTQYFTTQSCDGNGSPYDPDMIVLNPVEQNIDKVTLVSSNLYGPDPQVHHLQVIMRNTGTGISSFKLDGAAVTNTWIVHPADPNYSYVYLGNVSQGYHTLSSDSGFNALAYGYASAESYGYSAGANVKDLYQFISIKNQFATVNFPAGCQNSPFYFSMTFPYQPAQIKWVFGGSLNAMGISDTTINNPNGYDSTWFINGRQLFRYKLPAIYTVAAAGTFPIQVLAQNPTADGCSGEQQIDFDLQIFAPPVANFSFTTNGCVTDTVRFLGAANSDGRTIISHTWSLGDGSFSYIQSPAHRYLSAGDITVKYSVITDVGCLSDTARQTISLGLPPVAGFTISTPVCEDKVLSFTNVSVPNGSPITKWTWNFGDGTAPVVAADGNPQPHMYTAFGTNTASLLVETALGCKSILSTQQVLVSPNPFANFNFGNACLPAGTAQFTDQSSIVVGNISKWQWDFGDGSPLSLAQNPLHNFSATGPFNVRLTVTSDYGCVDDSLRIMDKVYAPPIATFASPVEICLGATAALTDQSSAPGSTLAQWLWDFGDGTTSTEQNPAKTYTTANTYTIKLTVTSAAGCSSSTVSKTIVVNPLPVADFLISAPNCINQDIIFTDASKANAGSIVKWTWDIGDGSNPLVNPGSSFAHAYATIGNYDAVLKIETDKGCSGSVSHQIKINPLPDASFVLPESCLNDPFSSFFDISTISDGTQSQFTYQWKFGDLNATTSNPNSSTLKNPQHRYTATGPYSVTQTVTSGNGCSSSVTQTFIVNGSVPIPAFALGEGQSICSGSTIHLTENSTVNPGSIVRLEIYWDYGLDPTNNTVDENPAPGKIYSHTYAEFNAPANKTITIRYVVYSGVTCLQYTDKVITLLATPAVQFSAMAGICKDVPTFPITQAGITNGLPGTGSFTGSGTSPTGLFSPSLANEGIDTIRYTFNANNGCTNYIDQTIQVYPVPPADAGPDKFVLEGGVVELTPSVKVNYPVTYLWTPATWLNSDVLSSPKVSPHDDITYTLTLTSEKGCTSSDDVFVKVLKAPLIPNVFSPNNDGVHDKWDVPYLASYPGCTVDIYNRYGQLVFHSVGYDKPWDGMVNGKQVPVGTYYYIIDPKNGRQKISGYVDVIR